MVSSPKYNSIAGLGKVCKKAEENQGNQKDHNAVKVGVFLKELFPTAWNPGPVTKPSKQENCGTGDRGGGNEPLGNIRLKPFFSEYDVLLMP